jgi:hypothetical protein
MQFVSGCTYGLGASPSIDGLVVRKVQSFGTPRPGVVVTDGDFSDLRVRIEARSRPLYRLQALDDGRYVVEGCP